MKKILLLVFCAAIIATQAQNYKDIARLRAMNQGVTGIRGMADGEHYTVQEKNNVVKYAFAQAGAGENLLPALGEKFDLEEYLLSPDGHTLLVAEGARPIYRHSYTTRYHLGTAEGLQPILSDMQQPRDASFSPDGRQIAFSNNNNLYLYNIATRKVEQLTQDGAWNRIINGTTDWVYEEEFGFTQAYAFSPDSRKIAYLRFDESEVPVFEMMRYDSTLYNKAYSFKYPKAGEPNSTVQLWLYDLASHRSTRIDTGEQTDQYIPRIGWTPGGLLYFDRLNRKQNHFEVVLCRANGTQQIIYDEHSPRYVERVDQQTVTFVDEDRFIVRQETATGYMHLYLYSVSHGRLNAITAGRWEVTGIVAVTDQQIYYLSTETSPLRRNLYRIRFDGSDKQRLTSGEGIYTIVPSEKMNYYVSTFSNVSTPNRVEICAADGKVVRTLKTNKKLRKVLSETARPQKEFFTFVTERGDTLNAFLIKPRDFDPSKRYPVLLTQYSGPGSQEVKDRWSVDWEDALVDAGYVVVCADGRGTGFRGETFKKQTYGQMGAQEIEDQLSTAKYMLSQPYIDPARVGIYGWSYGGFMALGCAFKGDGLFKMAIAVAPVTSWRFYDSIYTEIYNDLPQDNAAGYDDNSPLNFANLFNDKRTRLLLIHGTADDNVHFQNTMEMTRVLNRLGKQYDMMVYPDQNHSMMPDDRNNVRCKMVEYTLRNL
ncbi:MAG: S9 family peptidase [Alistipes sp.]